MKITKAPVLLKKAVTICKSKTSMLATRIIVLTSFCRRMATFGAISHRIHELMVTADREKGSVDCHKVLVEKMPAIHGGEIIDISDQLALFHQETDNDGCADWTLHPLVVDGDNKNHCYTDEYGHEGDEPLKMDVIGSSREMEELEFNMDNDIDQAAEMFIRRFREQLNKSF